MSNSPTRLAASRLGTLPTRGRDKKANAPPPRSSDAGAHLRLASSVSRKERGSGAPKRRTLSCAHRAKVSVAASNVGRSPLGAPPRCCIRAGPFFRTGPERLTRPLSSGVLRPPSVRSVQRASMATQLPRGSRRTSRRASQSRAYEARPAGHRSRLRCMNVS